MEKVSLKEMKFPPERTYMRSYYYEVFTDAITQALYVLILLYF